MTFKINTPHPPEIRFWGHWSLQHRLCDFLGFLVPPTPVVVALSQDSSIGGRQEGFLCCVVLELRCVFLEFVLPLCAVYKIQ